MKLLVSLMMVRTHSLKFLTKDICNLYMHRFYNEAQKIFTWYSTTNFHVLGSYSEGKYEDSNQYNNNGNGNNYNNGNGFNNGNDFNNANNYNGNDFSNTNNGDNLRDFNGDEDSVVTNAAFRTNQPSRGFDGATKAYLPPNQTQRAQDRNGLGPRSRARPSFNARDGYNY